RSHPGACRDCLPWDPPWFSRGRPWRARLYRSGPDGVDEPIIEGFPRVEPTGGAHVVSNVFGGPASGLRDACVKSPHQPAVLFAQSGDLIGSARELDRGE